MQNGYNGWAVLGRMRNVIIKTVADTRRAAIVNWLMTDGNTLVLNTFTDERIERLWEHRSVEHGVIVSEVLVTTRHQVTGETP